MKNQAKTNNERKKGECKSFSRNEMTQVRKAGEGIIFKIAYCVPN